MVTIHSGTQNEFDSGIGDSSENASDPKNSEICTDRQLELQERDDLAKRFELPEQGYSDNQLELQKRYEYAIKEGINAVASFQNEECALEITSETSETSNDDGLQSLSGSSSFEGDTTVMKARLPGMADQPSTIINNITGCTEFSSGIKYEVTNNNNVIVNVERKNELTLNREPPSASESKFISAFF